MTDEAPNGDESPASDAGAADTTPPPADAAASTGAPDDASGPGSTDPTLPETSTVAPAATAASATPAPAATSSEDRRGVFVPRWVAFLVAGLVALLLVGGAGFALGRATDDGHDDDRAATRTFPGGDDRGGPRGGGDGGGIPFPLPGGGNGGGNGGGGGLPSVPDRGVLLGVSVESIGGDTGGARVTQVVAGSPAQSGGLQAGDVITKVDDTQVSDAQELVAAIRSHGSGDQVTITYERAGQTKTVHVTLGGTGSGSKSSSSNN